MFQFSKNEIKEYSLQRIYIPDSKRQRKFERKFLLGNSISLTEMESQLETRHEGNHV
ncbi:hypothetical protein LEP1GSC016_0222 [Leptospira borgpetersenii serovar Hardjo-bovis str. Sponselee]|uniref:Uncharacterized protein n=1 Tax=Leptospira borgpetersenii serovar Hardjo-bovis str. Sponselee TaxID=1303729 RepID=M6BVL1_LEPBO|nr:hypothetical protein LEP1GSC016_0222 [Leptospira borgpetersenii serovar Hardjo-bovis str. Sponselee]